MAQTTIDFSSGITDGTAGGASGDNSLQIGDFIFTITAQGDWTADFSSGRFNFQEDAAFGSELFTIAITSASGALIDFYDYQISVDADPTWPGIIVDWTTWADDELHGDGIGPYYFRSMFPSEIPVSRGTSISIADNPIDGTTGRITMWLDNITFDYALPAPRVSSVTSSTPDGHYKAGDTIAITVSFDQDVNITGTPQLALETGGTDRVINYSSGSGTNTLTFSYTVQSGDTSADLDYISTAALTLNGGTIRNADGTDATITLPSPGAAGSLGSNKGLVIDTSAPTAVITMADVALIAGESTTITITFSEAVTGFVETDLIVQNGDVTNFTTSDNITYTATFTPSAGVDNPTNLIVLVPGAAIDSAGNPNSVTAPLTYSIDTVAPTVASVATPANGTYRAGQNLDFTVNLSEATTVDTSGGTPRIAVTIGTDTVYATYVSGSGSSALVFRLTLTEGLQDADGIALSGPIELNGGTMQDVAGNDIEPALNSVAPTTSVLVDAVRPTATIDVADTLLAAGETSTVTITFSEAVTGFDLSDLSVANGTLSDLASVDGGVTWTATLTPTAGISDATNLVILNTSLVMDAAGNTGSGIAISNNYAIDAGPPPNVPPTLTGDLEATVKEGGSYKLTTADLDFSDPDDGVSGVRFTVSAASNGKLYVSGTAASTFTAAELAAGKVTFLHDGSETNKASFKVSVEDGNEDGTSPVNSTFNFTVTPVNDAPKLTGDLKATVKEGGSYKLTTADLNFSDPDDSAAGVRFTVSAPSNGKVHVNGKAATSFTGAELAAGKVSFVHSGSESTKASFKVSVEDGNEDGSTPVGKIFNLGVTPVNDAPKLTGDLKATVKEGGSYKLTTADLNFSDPDDSAAGVRFTVSAPSNGKVHVDGKAATSFTGTELAGGKVTFVHNGSETTKASFKVSVEDGNEDRSTPVPKTFNFGVTPVNDAPKLVATQTLLQIAEDASTASARKVATLSISDPDGGNNKLSLAGSDAKLFEIKNGALWLKKGISLDYETNRSLDVTVRLDDPSIGTKHEAWKTFKVTVIDVAETKPGTSGTDKLTGTTGNDVLDGKGGNDIISGGAGNDRLVGGTGVDTLTGGSGRDTFVFASFKDSAPGQSGLVNNGGYNPLSGNDKRDIITDFVHAQDKLDVSQIDADSTRSGDQDFVWRGKNDFTGKAGELIFRTFDEKGTANDRTIVYGDTDRDHRADFQIELAGIIGLTKGDFIL